MLRAVSGTLRSLRVVTVILAITAMLCVSAASVSASHTHLNAPGDRCDICSTAHMATHQIAVVHVVHAPELRSFVAPALTVQRVESRRILALLTRGPPSSL
jgi:hypothetical protein